MLNSNFLLEMYITFTLCPQGSFANTGMGNLQMFTLLTLKKISQKTQYYKQKIKSQFPNTCSATGVKFKISIYIFKKKKVVVVFYTASQPILETVLSKGRLVGTQGLKTTEMPQHT